MRRENKYQSKREEWCVWHWADDCWWRGGLVHYSFEDALAEFNDRLKDPQYNKDNLAIFKSTITTLDENVYDLSEWKKN